MEKLYCTNSKHKKAGPAKLITKKLRFKAKNIIRYKEGY